MDAIKKKMLAMKLEKENATDKADQLEQSVKEKEDQMQKKEEEMSDVQKKLQQIQQDCDTAQEALGEVNTKLETTEKRATDGASGNRRWPTKQMPSTSRTTEHSSPRDFSDHDRREDKPRRRRPPRHQSKYKGSSTNQPNQSGTVEHSAVSKTQDDINYRLYYPQRSDQQMHFGESSRQEHRRKSQYDTGRYSNPVQFKQHKTKQPIIGSSGSGIGHGSGSHKSQKQSFDKNTHSSNQYTTHYTRNIIHSERQSQPCYKSKRQRKRDTNYRYKNIVNSSSQTSSPLASSCTSSAQSPLHSQNESVMSLSFSIMQRPDPEGACCTPSTYIKRDILGDYPSLTRKAIWDEFERTIFNDDKIYSDYGGDSESESEYYKFENYENMLNPLDEKSTFNEAFSAVNLNSGTLIRLAIIGAEMQNIVKSSVNKVSNVK